MNGLVSTLPVFPNPRPIQKPGALHLHSTHDLLGRFRVSPSYEAFVRPYVRPREPIEDKGKHREADGLNRTTNLITNHRIPHGLKGFLADIPGKTSTKKSTSIADLMLAPPKQRMDITRFDARSLELFRLPEGQIVYRNPSALDADAEAKKKRKKKRMEEAPGTLPVLGQVVAPGLIIPSPAAPNAALHSPHGRQAPQSDIDAFNPRLRKDRDGSMDVLHPGKKQKVAHPVTSAH